MIHTASGFVLILLAAVAAQAQEGTGAMNPLLDPFAANVRTVLPPPPTVKAQVVPLPSMAPPAPAMPNVALPAGMRVLLIRDSGAGLLGTADAQAACSPWQDSTHWRPGLRGGNRKQRNQAQYFPIQV
jgi:hypothetical protein